MRLDKNNDDQKACPASAGSSGERSAEQAWESNSTSTLPRPKNFAKTIRRILVPLALDHRSERQLTEAADLADKFGAELFLLYCYPQKNYSARYTTAEQFDHWNTALKKNAEKALNQFKSRFDHIPTIKNAQVLVHHGFLEVAIEKIVAEVQPDIIFITSHANCGMKRLFLGSKAEAIVRHAHSPVLIVPDEAID